MIDVDTVLLEENDPTQERIDWITRSSGWVGQRAVGLLGSAATVGRIRLEVRSVPRCPRARGASSGNSLHLRVPQELCSSILLKINTAFFVRKTDFRAPLTSRQPVVRFRRRMGVSFGVR
jgi:hypothetical protein